MLFYDFMPRKAHACGKTKVEIIYYKPISRLHTLTSPLAFSNRTYIL